MPTPTPIAKQLLHAALLTTLALAAPTRADDCDEKWLPDLGLTSDWTGGAIIYATTLWDPDGPGPAGAQLVGGGRLSVWQGLTTPATTSVARWDGSTWRSFGRLAANGFNSEYVESLAVLNDGTLVIGGEIRYGATNSDRLPGVARWDGAAWRPLGPVDTSGKARRMTVLADGSLLATGGLSPGASSAVSLWTGAAWAPLPTIINIFSSIDALLPDGAGLVVGGKISSTTVPGGEDVMRWTGPYPGTWSATPPPGETGPATYVRSMTRLPNGDLVVAGRLDAAGTKFVARWDGSVWIPMDAGLEGTQEVSAIYARPDGTLIAGTGRGHPTILVEAKLLRWTGAAWETTATLGEGKTVFTLGPMPDGGVVAGGDFVQVTQDQSTLPARGILRLGTPVPVIYPYPFPSVPCPRGTATFTVDIANATSDLFQWELRDDAAPGGWIALSDGPTAGFTIEGTATPQLRITPIAAYSADALPEVRVVVTNACGSSTSRSAPVQPCPADWDCSGGIDGDDIAAFFTDWQQGNGDADMSGATDGDDITAFFAAWQRGACFPRL